MALVHSYTMIARAGSEAALADALQALAEAVKTIAGSQGAMVLCDRKESQNFLFLEFWDSEIRARRPARNCPRK